jgi:hypothetical protein
MATYSDITSARDLEAMVLPAKKPLLDSAPMTSNAWAHTATPLAELTYVYRNICANEYT